MSHYVNSPIIVRYNAIVNEPDATFHRAMCRIELSGIPGASADFTQSHPVSQAGQEILFDIAPSMAAYADRYEYQYCSVPDGSTTIACRYPIIFAKVYFYEELMLNGRIQQSKVTVSAESPVSAYLGQVHDYLRRVSEQIAIEDKLSLKPSSGELALVGDPYFYPDLWNGDIQDPDAPFLIPVTRYTKLPNVAGLHTISPSAGFKRNVFLTSDPRRSHLFQFVNSRGCIESIRAWAPFSAEKAQFSNAEHVISRFERFGDFSRSILTKHARPTELSLTSGYVDPEWAQWWVHEFCASSHVWMQHVPSRNGTPVWLPVTVNPSESLTVIDRSKNELLHVDFTVTPDLNGPIW